MLSAIHPRSPNPPTLVSDLIDEPLKAWIRQLVMQHLQPPDAQVILNIPLSSRILEDSWAWHYERGGIFSVPGWAAFVVKHKSYVAGVAKFAESKGP